MNEKYFAISVLMTYVGEKADKKVTEQYLIKGISPTDVEAKLFKHFEDTNVREEFRITSLRETRILSVIE